MSPDLAIFLENPVRIMFGRNIIGRNVPQVISSSFVSRGSVADEPYFTVSFQD